MAFTAQMRKAIVKVIRTALIREGVIVEVGCGLCDIIGDKSLKSFQRIGVEYNENVYNVAQKLHSKSGIKFINGSFMDLRDMDIDVLIAVNFMHTINSENIKDMLKILDEQNDLHYLIVDEVHGNYKYYHQYVELVPKGYIEKSKMGPYSADGGERYVKIFEKVI